MFPSVWWPIAAPWGGLLSAMTIFLMVTSQFTRLVQFPMSVPWELDASVRPLAVLRVRAKLAVTVSYYRADKLPDVREALVRQVIPALPPPPIPENLGQLGEDWLLVEDPGSSCAPRAPFLLNNHARDPECDGRRSRLTWQKVLVAKRYHPAMDAPGITQALHDARATGVASNLVFIEPDDDAQLGAIIEAMDLCVTAGLRPVLRPQ